MKCSSCNKRLRKSFSYCPSCGSSLEENKEVLEVISPEESDTTKCSCSSDNCNCNSDNQSTDSNFEKFQKQSASMRRKSLFYLFAISSVFIYFSLSIVIILNQLSKIEEKNNEFHSFFYSYVNDNNPISIEGLTDGHLSFEKHKLYLENEKTHVEFYLKSYGHPKFNEKSIFSLNQSNLEKFTLSLGNDLWKQHISEFSFDRTSNLYVKIYIDGKFHSVIKK